MPRGCIITIIAGSLVMLAGSIFYYLFFWPDHQRMGTSMSIHVIEKGLVEYAKDYGALPSIDNGEIAGLLLGENSREKEYIGRKTVVLRDGLLVDFWKRPLRFEADADTAKVLSAGKNGEFDDDDDIGSQLLKDVIELRRDAEEDL